MPKRTTSTPKKASQGYRLGIPWKHLSFAVAALALTAFYLTVVAPARVPVPEGVSVPFPEATRFLETVCAWCGQQPLAVAAIAFALLLPGLLLRIFFTAERYYLVLTILVGLALGFTYLSISAPIDRFLHAVENALPDDNRIPEYGNEKDQKKTRDRR